MLITLNKWAIIVVIYIVMILVTYVYSMIIYPESGKNAALFNGFVWPLAWVVELPIIIAYIFMKIGDSIVNKFTEKDDK